MVRLKDSMTPQRNGEVTSFYTPFPTSTPILQLLDVQLFDLFKVRDAPFSSNNRISRYFSSCFSSRSRYRCLTMLPNLAEAYSPGSITLTNTNLIWSKLSQKKPRSATAFILNKLLKNLSSKILAMKNWFGRALKFAYMNQPIINMTMTNSFAWSFLVLTLLISFVIQPCDVTALKRLK